MTDNSEQTISGVKTNMEYAGFWVRVSAYFVDYAILMFLGLVLTIGSSLADGMVALIGSITISLVFLFYYPVMESSARQATFGKSFTGIKVTGLNGERLSFGRAFLRNIAKILSALPLNIGFLLAAFTKRKQALHDILAKSLVVRTGPSHFLKAVGAAVGGLVVVVVCGVAYFYYVYLPQVQSGLYGKTQEAAKKSATISSAPKPPAVKAATPAPVISAVSGTSATISSAPNPPATLAAAPAPAISAVPGTSATISSAPKPPAAKAATTTSTDTAATSTSKPRMMVPEELKKSETKLGNNLKKDSMAADNTKASSKTALTSPSHSEPSVAARKSAKAKPPISDAPLAPVANTVAVTATPELPRNIITVKFNDLVTATMYEDQAAVKELLDLGWWVDKPDPSGFTPLMHAAKIGNMAIAELLLKYGADPNLVSKYGDSALRLAKYNKNLEIVNLLQQHGATVK